MSVKVSSIWHLLFRTVKNTLLGPDTRCSILYLLCLLIIFLLYCIVFIWIFLTCNFCSRKGLVEFNLILLVLSTLICSVRPIIFCHGLMFTNFAEIVNSCWGTLQYYVAIRYQEVYSEGANIFFWHQLDTHSICQYLLSTFIFLFLFLFVPSLSHESTVCY